MWNQGGMGGGGFLETTYESPSGAAAGGEKKNRDRRAENLVPVTIRQILTSGDEFRIGEVVVHMVTFVALVKNIDMSSTKLSYLMEDTTGQIEATVWLEGSAENEQAVMNSYYRVIGSVRSGQGKRYILVFHMEALKDLNDLTRHLLEVINVSICAPKLSSIESSSNQVSSMSNMNQQLGNSLMNMNQTVDDGLDAQAPTDPKQRMVFRVIWDAAIVEDGGVDVPFIAKKLNNRMKVDQIRTITDYLLQEGFIFSTVDDEHFTVTR